MSKRKLTLHNPTFLLGAGFSFYATRSFNVPDQKPMPLLPDLSEGINAKEIVPEPVQRLGDNLEEWLSYLATPQPWIKSDAAALNRSKFIQLSRDIAAYIESRLKPFAVSPAPHWLDHLIRHWHRSKANVITLNYDTLIEGLTSRIEKERSNDGTMYPVPISRGSQRMGTDYDGAGPRIPTTRLFKLHGSTNWRRSESSPGQPIYYINTSWGFAKGGVEADARSVIDLEPFIIPPTFDKSGYLAHDTVRELWRQAAISLSLSGAVVVMGYSLPQSDLTMKAFLKVHSPKEKVPLYVVDKRPETVDHYRDALADHYSVNGDFVGDDAIKDFTGFYLAL